jgi:rubredoxin
LTYYIFAINKYKKCGWFYDTEKGDLNAGLESDIDFNDLPEGWGCPICGTGKRFLLWAGREF